MSAPAAREPSAVRTAARDLRWTLAGASVPAALMALANMLLARTLGVQDYGAWVFFTQMAGSAATVLLGVATFTLSYHLPRGDYAAPDLVGAAGRGALAVGLVGAVATVALAPLALEAPSPALVAAGAALTVAACVQYWAFAALDALLRFAARARFAVVNGALTVVAVIAMAGAGMLEPSLAVAARAVTFGAGAFFAWRLVRTTLRTAERTGPRLRGGAGLRLVLGTSWPVTAGSVLGAGTTAGVLTAIGAFGGQQAVGAAGVGMLLAQPIALLSIGLSSVLLPHGARDPGAHRSLRRVGLGVSALALAYTVLASFLGEWLFEVVTGEPPTGEVLAIALLLLWGNWLKQLAGVDVVMLRARGRLYEGLVTAITGTLPVVPLVSVASMFIDERPAQVAAAWATAQGLAAAVALRAARVGGAIRERR